MTASSFPEFITARRRELDLTLGDVAAGLGVSPITVSNWSNGDSKPQAENLVALAELLDVPADKLADMAGVALKPTQEPSVNPVPGEVDNSVDEPLTEDAGEPVGVPISMASIEPPSVEAPVAPPAIDDELIELLEAADPGAEGAPDSVPAFVSAGAPEPAAAPRPEVAPARKRRPAKRPGRPAAAEERQVTTLPLTYIEDPRQLMRYRIRWALTVVILFIMFLVLLWATREFISALSEVKQAVTPGGIGGS